MDEEISVSIKSDDYISSDTISSVLRKYLNIDNISVDQTYDTKMVASISVHSFCDWLVLSSEGLLDPNKFKDLTDDFCKFHSLPDPTGDMGDIE